MVQTTGTRGGCLHTQGSTSRVWLVWPGGGQWQSRLEALRRQAYTALGVLCDRTLLQWEVDLYIHKKTITVVKKVVSGMKTDALKLILRND